MSIKHPHAVLFACTMNAIRSPMAAAILHHTCGAKIYVASCGIAAGDPDPFVAMVMDEIDIDVKNHLPHSFEDLEDSAFDLLITLSPQAEKHAKRLARNMAIGMEHWPISDPSGTSGSREQILAAYRSVRDDLVKRVQARFPQS